MLLVPAILPSAVSIHSESSSSLFPAARAALPLFRCGSSLRITPARSPFSAARSVNSSANAPLPRAAFHPAPVRIAALARSAGALRFDLRGVAGARFSGAACPARGYAPASAARAQTGRGSPGIGWHSSTVAEKRPAPLLPLWSPAAKCAAPARTQCASDDRRAVRKRALLSGEAAAPVPRRTTRRRSAWVSKPPGTRVRLLLSL